MRDRTPRTQSSQPAAAAPLTELSGWGRNLRSSSHLREPETEAEVRRQLTPGCIARGLERSYGDAPLNDGRAVLGMSRMDRYLAFDPAGGVLTCEAGVSLEQIIHDFGPRGFFPMITPGTKFVTVGGAIANDVHGKAQHVQGCFSSCVESMRVPIASGDVLNVSREEHPDLFWATFGGMGLLGIVLTATIRLRKIETTYFHQRAVRTNNLDEMLDALAENDAKYPYSVAYVDPVAKGARLGGGVLTVGDHALLADLPPAITTSGELPFLNVLKRFGKESGGTLSFPREGYTFAIEFPIRQHTVALVHRLDEMVLNAGGRIYLGKDSYVTPEMLRRMYGSAVDALLAVRAKGDPTGVFTSDLARRVGLA